MTTSGKQIPSAPSSGMRDMGPYESSLRDWATAIILETYKRFGFTRIETPALENIDLLRRGEGGENLNLIFEVLKRGEKFDRELEQWLKKCGSTEEAMKEAKSLRYGLADLGLRFDLTVPLVRFFAHQQSNLPNPFKAIQIGPVWRAESPQQGRFRQFTQCDIDVFGIKSEAAEMDLLQATAEALFSLSFKDFTIRINDRRILSSLAQWAGYREDEQDVVFIAMDKLDKINLSGVQKELETKVANAHATAKLMTVLEALEKKGQNNGNADMAQIRSALPQELGDDHFAPLKNIIDTISSIADGRYHIAFDPTLVRGMGYYTGPIFEVSTAGYSYSIAGGGRYDRMVGKFSGRDVPACGFSIGFERIISILADQKFIPPSASKKIALIYDPDRDNLTDVMKSAQKLRSDGHSVSSLPRKKDMRKQLDGLIAEDYSAFCAYRGDPNNLEIKELERK